MTPKIESKKHIARLERERRQNRLIINISIGVVAAVILILVYGYLDLTVLRLHKPVAEINGEKVSVKEFQARVILQRNQMLNQYYTYLQYQQFGLNVSSQLQQLQLKLTTPTLVGQDVLDALIQEALIRQDAEKRGITVSTDEIDAFAQQQFGYFPNGTLTPTITPTAVDLIYPTLSAKQLTYVTATPSGTKTPTPTAPPTATLEVAPTATLSPTPFPTYTPSPTATPYTLEGYQNQFATAEAGMQDLGLTVAQYRTLFETELLRQRLFEIVTADTPHTEEQVWARHILVSSEDEAKAVIERLKNGEDFGALAAELSQDTGSAQVGGDLGWFGKGQMVAEFETAAFALKDGEISQPVQSDFGWHVIQVLGHAELPLTATAYKQARQDAFNAYLQNLRDNADVTIYDYWKDFTPATPTLDPSLIQNQQQPPALPQPQPTSQP